MRTLTIILIALLNLSTNTACAQLFEDAKDAVEETTNAGSSGLSQEEAAKGIKEALKKGAKKGVADVSQLNGYFKNPEIKIPFPPDAQEVADKMRDIGMGDQVAADQAKPIFINAITSLTIQDAIDIVNGKDNAATNYLRRTTSSQLKKEFKPDIEKSLDKVNATKYWNDIITRYNKIPMVEDKNPDLAEHVTDRAIKGLFVMVAKEENKIREEPIARTSDILKKVFGD
ncbi:MAG: DUF4197 domain-containing protein [Bacteroidetes bacterium SW_11_45_7]|nr:MAG: DUF4197 domain-containing protein [Bacteroidetes bacterium SW_11_45_7]